MASKWRKRMLLVEHVERRFKEKGLGYVIAKSISAVLQRLTGPAEKSPESPSERKPLRDPAVLCLNLRPSEWVEVKSLDEIMQTLDANEKCQGLAFTREMAEHCGKRYRVFKRLELLFNEYTREQRKVKNTVLLEGVYCRGTGFGCDRCCFHFWREAWLRRVEQQN